MNRICNCHFKKLKISKFILPNELCTTTMVHNKFILPNELLHLIILHDDIPSDVDAYISSVPSDIIHSYEIIKYLNKNLYATLHNESTRLLYKVYFTRIIICEQDQNISFNYCLGSTIYRAPVPEHKKKNCFNFYHKLTHNFKLWNNSPYHYVFLYPYFINHKFKELKYKNKLSLIKREISSTNYMKYYPHTVMYHKYPKKYYKASIFYRIRSMIYQKVTLGIDKCDMIIYKLKNKPMQIAHVKNNNVVMNVFTIGPDLDSFKKYITDDTCFEYHKNHNCGEGKACNIHRENNPALTIKMTIDDIFGNLLCKYAEIYFHFGMIHRDINSGPAIISKELQSGGIVRREKWIHYSKLHNIDKPAEICYFNDQMIYYCYARKGLLHRRQNIGPAVMHYYPKKKKYVLFYMEQGYLCEKNCLIVLNYNKNEYQTYDKDDIKFFNDNINYQIFNDTNLNLIVNWLNKYTTITYILKNKFIHNNIKNIQNKIIGFKEI